MAVLSEEQELIPLQPLRQHHSAPSGNTENITGTSVRTDEERCNVLLNGLQKMNSDPYGTTRKRVLRNTCLINRSFGRENSNPLAYATPDGLLKVEVSCAPEVVDEVNMV